MVEIFNYEEWKKGVDIQLDNLVAKNYEKIYLSKEGGYMKVWGEISKELFSQYDLMEQSEDSIAKKKRDYLYISMRHYSEKEFPWELSDERTYRFVNQYGKLPKQLPNEWANFEIEDRQRLIREETESHDRIMNFFKRYKQEHSRGCYKY